MVATISTGERRPPSPVPLSGLGQARRETAGIRSIRRPPSNVYAGQTTLNERMDICQSRGVLARTGPAVRGTVPLAERTVVQRLRCWVMERVPERIGVTGDWHGNTPWATRAIRKISALLPAGGPRVI